MITVSYIIGVIGIIVNALIYQQKNGKKLLLFKLASDIFWSLHYLLLGAYAGAAIAAVNIFRELLFLHQFKTGRSDKRFLILFLIIGEISTVISAVISESPMKKWASILIAIAVIVSTYAFWKSEPKLSRSLAIPVSACMMTYDILVGSPIGIINECITLASTFYGIYTKDIKHKRNDK